MEYGKHMIWYGYGVYQLVIVRNWVLTFRNINHTMKISKFWRSHICQLSVTERDLLFYSAATVMSYNPREQRSARPWEGVYHLQECTPSGNYDLSRQRHDATLIPVDRPTVCPGTESVQSPTLRKICRLPAGANDPRRGRKTRSREGI